MTDISSTTGTTSSSSSTASSNTNYYLLNTGTSNSLRVSGLVSGIDVDSIVNKLMQAEEVPLDSMKQQLQLLEWKRDTYRSMNTLLQNLQDSVNTLTLQSNYTKAATVSDPSKVTVTAGTNAKNGTYTLSNATLATIATNSSTASIASSDFDSSQPLINEAAYLTNGVAWTTNTVSNETKTVTADGTSFQLANGAVDTGSASISVKSADGTETSYTVVGSKDDLNTSDPSQHQVFIDQTTGALTFNQTIASGSTITSNYNYKTVDIDLTTYDSDGNAINTSLSLNGSLSLDTMLTRLNNSGAGVSAFYDASTKKVAISTTQTGNMNADGSEMDFTSNFLTTTLGLDCSNETGGTDATFTLNGLATSRHSNTFTINNTTFNLTGSISADSPVTVSVGTDTDAVYTMISNFVTQYNDAIDQMNTQIGTAPDRDYPPLTDAQKAQMNATDITNWNEKAEQGILYNDNILSSALSQMRLNLYSPVSGLSGTAGDTGQSYNQLAQIGITTSSDYSEHGKLVIDESTLKAAISADPDGVMKLFTQSGTDSSSQGIAKRLYNTLSNTISQVKQEAGTTSMADNQYDLGQSIDDMNTKISNFTTQLEDVQNRYYSEFTAMEQAIEQANSQSAYLTNMMSS